MTMKKHTPLSRAALARTYADRLRRRMTPTDTLLHDAMKKKRWSFQAQVPMFDATHLYIADFVVDVYGGRLVIEVDGPCHKETERYDSIRDARMRRKCCVAIIRVTAKEVLLELPRVLGVIRSFFPRSL